MSFSLDGDNFLQYIGVDNVQLLRSNGNCQGPVAHS
jgi:hypothetical protein